MTEVASEEARGPKPMPGFSSRQWLSRRLSACTGSSTWISRLPAVDGENGHFGMIGITDLPFTGFVDSVRSTNLLVLDQLGQEAAKAQVDADQAAKAPVQQTSGWQRWKLWPGPCRRSFR